MLDDVSTMFIPFFTRTGTWQFSLLHLSGLFSRTPRHGFLLVDVRQRTRRLHRDRGRLRSSGRVQRGQKFLHFGRLLLQRKMGSGMNLEPELETYLRWTWLIRWSPPLEHSRWFDESPWWWHHPLARPEERFGDSAGYFGLQYALEFCFNGGSGIFQVSLNLGRNCQQCHGKMVCFGRLIVFALPSLGRPFASAHPRAKPWKMMVAIHGSSHVVPQV